MQLTTDMRKDEFARRRRQLMKMMGRGAIAILPAVPEKTRNSDVSYEYRPDSDFFYLTGFAEPEAVAVLIPGRAAAEYILFVARARPDPRNLGRPARRSGRGDSRLRRGRCVSHQRHRRHPAGTDGALLARLLHDGPAPGIRPARDRLGECVEDSSAHRHPSAPGVRRAGSPVARHAAVQVASGTGRDARIGTHRGRRAQARHEVRPARAGRNTR